MVNGRTTTIKTTMIPKSEYQMAVKLNPPHCLSPVVQSIDAPAFATSSGKKQIADTVTVMQRIYLSGIPRHPPTKTNFPQ